VHLLIFPVLLFPLLDVRNVPPLLRRRDLNPGITSRRRDLNSGITAGRRTSTVGKQQRGGPQQ